MEIKQLKAENYKEIITLWKRAGLPIKPKGRDRKEAVFAEMRANPEYFLGAFEDDLLVGVVVLSSDARKGWINRLAVDPAYRRRGIAKALVADSEKMLRKKGYGIISCLIEKPNPASESLFKSCGYVEHDDIRYFSKRESDDV